MITIYNHSMHDNVSSCLVGTYLFFASGFFNQYFTQTRQCRTYDLRMLKGSVGLFIRVARLEGGDGFLDCFAPTVFCLQDLWLMDALFLHRRSICRHREGRMVSKLHHHIMTAIPRSLACRTFSKKKDCFLQEKQNLILTLGDLYAIVHIRQHTKALKGTYWIVSPVSQRAMQELKTSSSVLLNDTLSQIVNWLFQQSHSSCFRSASVSVRRFIG
jgi:hypothetical protein